MFIMGATHTIIIIHLNVWHRVKINYALVICRANVYHFYEMIDNISVAFLSSKLSIFAFVTFEMTSHFYSSVIVCTVIDPVDNIDSRFSIFVSLHALGFKKAGTLVVHFRRMKFLITKQNIKKV